MTIAALSYDPNLLAARLARVLSDLAVDLKDLALAEIWIAHHLDISGFKCWRDLLDDLPLNVPCGVGCVGIVIDHREPDAVPDRMFFELFDNSALEALIYVGSEPSRGQMCSPWEYNGHHVYWVLQGAKS